MIVSCRDSAPKTIMPEEDGHRFVFSQVWEKCTRVNGVCSRGICV